MRHLREQDYVSELSSQDKNFHIIIIIIHHVQYSTRI